MGSIFRFIIITCCAAILCNFAYVTPIKAEHDEIIALVPENWPPQYQVDAQGKISGFAIDVMNEIARQGHFKVKYKSYPNFSSVVDALIAGEGDLVPNSGILPDRLDEFLFTSPVETFYVRVFVRDEENNIKGPSDLSGKTVAVVEKNVGLFLLQDRNDMTLRVERDLQDALLSLISGNADALVYPGSVALAMARNADIDDRIKPVGEYLTEVKRGIRLLKGREELRDRLEPLVLAFIKTKEYQEIYNKWYGKLQPFLSNTQLWFAFSAILILSFFIFFAWRQISLRRLNDKLIAENAIRTRDLKKSEQLLEAAGRTAKLGGWELDVANQIVRWTSQVYEIHELSRDQKPQTLEEALSFYPEKERDKVRESLDRASQYGTPFDNEAEFITAKGKHLWVRAICEPEIIDGKVVKLVGTFQDITAKKESEQNLFRANAHAKMLLAEKETLIQEVHHRVKNNMQVILSMLSLQRRSAQGEHEVRALNESSRRVRVMAKLYEHLYQSDNVSDIGPKEYLSEVLNDALHAAGAPDDVEANLDCDDVTLKIKTATALAQVISELISNCLKHAFPDGKGQIDVSLKRLNEKELCLSVSDDGVGLPDGFDEKKLKSMGMKLVNALVMQIGGTKQIKSNGGTTVEITFEENN